MFPVIDALPGGDDLEILVLQKCLSLSKVAAVPGQPAAQVECRTGRESNTVLVTGTTDREILRQTLECLLYDSSDRHVDLLLKNMEQRRNSAHIRAIKKATTDAERLSLIHISEPTRQVR